MQQQQHYMSNLGLRFHPISSSTKKKTLPMIRILALSDVDLPSSSRLAEYTLRGGHDYNGSNPRCLGGGGIDACCLIGPLSSSDNTATTTTTTQDDWSNRPKEEQYSTIGTITATLSQLETIVCRVVYIPSSMDPPCLFSSEKKTHPLRLTPNSRNVQCRWLHLAPGLSTLGFGQYPCSSSDADDDDDCLLYSSHEQEDDNNTYLQEKRQKENDDDDDDIMNYIHKTQTLLQINPNKNHTTTPIQNQGIFMTHMQPRSTKTCTLHTQEEEETETTTTTTTTATNWPNAWPTSYSHLFDSKSMQDNIILSLTSSPSIIPRCNSSHHGRHELHQESSTLLHTFSPGEDEAQKVKDGEPFAITRGNVTIVNPGSLRVNGDFALIDVVLCPMMAEENEKKHMEEEEDQHLQSSIAADTTSQKENAKPLSFEWKVHGVQFHSLNQLNVCD
uniref:Uncharacterized protein n=1 Tax=Ditylum brightwellii TaxID=49249 RepID=A0A7S4VXK8_9STRA